MMKILFLSGWFPYPPDNGSKLRIYNLLRLLARQHDVTLLVLAQEEPEDRSPGPLEALCSNVLVAPRRSYRANSRRALLGLFSLTPRSIVDVYDPYVERFINCEVKAGHYDLVIASQWMTAAYWRAFEGVPAIYEEAELGVLMDRMQGSPTLRGRLRHFLTLVKLRIYLPRTLAHFRTCTVASVTEQRLVHDMVGDRCPIEPIPNCVDLVDYQHIAPVTSPQTLIFTGSFRYRPNYEAMVWFLSEIYPLIQAQVPDVKLQITGDGMDLPLPPARNVVRTGLLPDVRPLVAGATVSIAPLLTGGGTRLKVLEAMALCTPVVATSKGVEGLEVTHGIHSMIADTPADFAAQVVLLLQDPAVGCRLAENGLGLVSRQYDWAHVASRLQSLVAGAAPVNLNFAGPLVPGRPTRSMAVRWPYLRLPWLQRTPSPGAHSEDC